jgi:hypothetical protein
MVFNKVTHGVEEQENGMLPKRESCHRRESERIVSEERRDGRLSKCKRMECYTVAVRRPLGDRVYHKFEVREGDHVHDDGAGLLNSGLERKEVIESSNASTVHSHMFLVLVTVVPV